VTQSVPGNEYVPDGEAVGEGVEPMPEHLTAEGPDDHKGPEAQAAELQALVAERTADLQRLQAEYVNYKRRVDRDRSLAREAGVESVMRELLPIMDSIGLARDHEELTGGFKLVADEIEKVAAKHGLSSYGQAGDPFDPQLHDALMQVSMDGITQTTAAQILQTGYTLNGKVLRPARVAVAEPSEPTSATDAADPTDPVDPVDPSSTDDLS